MSTSWRLSGDSFVYGPNDLPIEQINNSTGTVEYVQQGSGQLLWDVHLRTHIKATDCPAAPWGRRSPQIGLS